jgi:PAS domain S-box-containing protein
VPSPPASTPGSRAAAADELAPAILESLPIALVVAEAAGADFAVTYANPAAVRVTNRPREELLGARLSAWPSAPGFAEACRSVLATGSSDVVKAGTLEAELVPLGARVLVAFHQLDDRGAQLAEAQRIAHFGSWEWDMRTSTVTWSDELYRIYGVAPHEYTPSYQGYLARVHPDDRERVAATISRAAEDQRPFSFTERVMRPDGSERVLESGGGVVVDEQGRPQKMIGACHDVTERAHDQAELERRRAAERQAKDINDSVIASLVDAVQALDAGDLRGAQRAMRATLGHASRIVTELVGQRPSAE